MKKIVYEEEFSSEEDSSKAYTLIDSVILNFDIKEGKGISLTKNGKRVVVSIY